MSSSNGSSGCAPTDTCSKRSLSAAACAYEPRWVKEVADMLALSMPPEAVPPTPDRPAAEGARDEDASVDEDDEEEEREEADA